jgi:hypothetical protein
MIFGIVNEFGKNEVVGMHLQMVVKSASPLT